MGGGVQADGNLSCPGDFGQPCGRLWRACSCSTEAVQVWRNNVLVAACVTAWTYALVLEATRQ